MTFGQALTSTVSYPVYSRNGNLVDCPSIVSIGEIIDSDSNDSVTADFTITLEENELSISTEEPNHLGKTFYLELKSTSSTSDGLDENANFYFTILELEEFGFTTD
jgi:hypothetical protein